MKIRVYSDLHTDISRHYGMKDTVASKLHNDVDVLVLCGDIGTENSYYDYLNYQFENCPNLIIVGVLGNHDYWGFGIHSRIAYFKETANTEFGGRFKFLEKDFVEIDGVRFIGATLWTDFFNHNYTEMLLAQTYMNDYRFIKSCDTETTYREHLKAREYIFNNINDNSIVVTHHKPYLSSSEGLSSAYESRLPELDEKRPKLWLYGHTHHAGDQMLYDDMRVVSNPRGYLGLSSRVCENFNADLIIEV